MEKTKIELDINDFPVSVRPYMQDAVLYDSSCSDHARVYYSDLGYYIKVEEKGLLETEAKLVKLFAQRGLGPEMMLYISEKKDYMVTREAVGEDCISQCYLEEPEKLVKVLAETMRFLHGMLPGNEGELNAPFDGGTESDIPISVAMNLYKEQGCLDKVKCDTFIHGDFCLPNILLRDGEFSCFIDVGAAGMGDRHIDIYWVLWSLNYNLKTDKYTDLFLDLYGREHVDMEVLKLVAGVEKLG